MERIPLDFDFDTFVRGDENLLAVSGALKVVNEPGNQFNPFFLFGPSSVGKTHLLYALRKRLEERYPNWNMLLLPAGEFIEECEHAWQESRTVEFRQHLWRLNALLLDDLHLLANRPGPLEEVYHLCNRYLADGKQLVFTSRLAPAEMMDFPLTLRSRFQSGLVVGIDPPRERLMRDILEQKCRHYGVRPTRKATNFLCKEVRSIRDLNGVITLLGQERNGRAKRLSLGEVRELLEANSVQRMTIADIARAVCNFYQVDLSKVCSASRRQALVQARQLSMYLARELTTAPLTEIGQFFGGRDHTTVLYAYKKVEEEMKQSAHTQRAAREIRAALRA